MKASLKKIRLPIENHSKDPVESDLHIRLLLLEDHEQRFALVQLELTSLQPYVVETLQNQLAAQLNMEPERIWVTVSHTFSAPHTRSVSAIAKDPQVKADNEAFCSMLYEKAAEAAAELSSSLQEISITTCCGSCGINVNRDLPAEQGWWKGENPKEFSSQDLPVIILKNWDEKILGILASYDLQSSWMQMNDPRKIISSDLFGQAMNFVEKENPDAVCLLLFGTGGDQMPSTRFMDMNEAGSILAQSIQQAVHKAAAQRPIEPRLAHQVQMLEMAAKKMKPTHEIQPVKQVQWQKEGQEELALYRLSLGPVELVGTPPELNSITGHEIRHNAGSKILITACMVNGSSKYLPDQTSYDRCTYEAQNSRYMPGGAEEIIRWLNQSEGGIQNS